MSPLALMFPLAVIFVNSNSPASILLPLPSFLVTLVEKLPLSDCKASTFASSVVNLVLMEELSEVILVEKLELSANKFVPKIFPLELISDEAVIFVDDTCSI